MFCWQYICPLCCDCLKYRFGKYFCIKIFLRNEIRPADDFTYDVKIMHWRHVACEIPYLAVVIVYGNITGLWNLCRKWRNILYCLLCTTKLWWKQIWREFGESEQRIGDNERDPILQFRLRRHICLLVVVHFLGGVWSQKLLKDSV